MMPGRGDFSRIDTTRKREVRRPGPYSELRRSGVGRIVAFICVLLGGGRRRSDR